MTGKAVKNQMPYVRKQAHNHVAEIIILYVLHRTRTFCTVKWWHTFGSKQGFTHELGKNPLFCVCISFPCKITAGEVYLYHTSNTEAIQSAVCKPKKGIRKTMQSHQILYAVTVGSAGSIVFLFHMSMIQNVFNLSKCKSRFLCSVNPSWGFFYYFLMSFLLSSSVI